MLPGSPRRLLPTVTDMSHLLGWTLIGTLARDNDFDVVLIDTAGRMQDNEVCLHFLDPRPIRVDSRDDPASDAGPCQVGVCE